MYIGYHKGIKIVFTDEDMKGLRERWSSNRAYEIWCPLCKSGRPCYECPVDNIGGMDCLDLRSSIANCNYGSNQYAQNIYNWLMTFKHLEE
jgi:hypothetical protein